jgi:Uma2 family endonuclease
MGKIERRRGLMTVEQFLAFERSSARRHEYVAGHVYLMSGTTARHNEIASNIHSRLRTLTRGGACKAYVIDMMVRAGDRFYYPDGVVVCAPHVGDTLLFEEPCLVVEVTSRSSRRTDHGEKLDAYLRVPSLRGYLIAEHNRRLVTLYTRADDGTWNREEAAGAGSLDVPCVSGSLSLDEVYDGVEMPPLSVREEYEGEDDPWPASEEDELELY